MSSTSTTPDAAAALLEDAFKQLVADRRSGSVTKAEPVEIKAEAPIKLEAGEVLFSSLFGKVPKNGRDFGVKLFEASPQLAGFVPKADPDYVPQIEEAARLVRGIIDNDKTLMTGPTGSGKSSLVKYVCSILKLPFIRINMSGDIESAAFFGQLVVRGGATVWEDGPMAEACKYGALVLIDEWELMPPEVSMGLQNLLESDGYLYLKEMPGTSTDKTIHPHQNFRLVCAGNTVGQGDDNGSFSGTMVQNSATIDRFTNTITLGYLGVEHEVNIITGKTKVSKSEAKEMVKLAGLVRTSYDKRAINLTMSPRTLINWANKQDRYGNRKDAFCVAFYDKLRDDDKKIVAELYGKVFGTF